MRWGIAAGALVALLVLAAAPRPAASSSEPLESASLPAHPFEAGLADAGIAWRASFPLATPPDAAAAERMRAWGQGIGLGASEPSKIEALARAGLPPLAESHANPDAVRAWAAGLASSDADAARLAILAPRAATLPAELTPAQVAALQLEARALAEAPPAWPR